MMEIVGGIEIRRDPICQLQEVATLLPGHVSGVNLITAIRTRVITV